MSEQAAAEDQAEPGTSGAAELALTLLRAIAEDPVLRSSHRVAARGHLRRLSQLAAEARHPAHGDWAA